ncbi:vWA domain-containing protein [Piscinibacter defluvii]|uniref:vWA domain-containing protein n=1 Tax=Piscinibacter defluvii TaxID=1796922 RepID=UPI000FDE33BA|nr:vWA domain-containing protein [Piscinibacter defluvii]
MPIRRRELVALAGLGGSLSAPPLWAQGKAPLLMDGKKTLFQKVLTRPGALLAAKAGDAAGKPLEPFSVFFVYERADAGGKPWLLVGAGSDGKTQGWLSADATVPWRHMITLSFAVPTNRQRVLFFRERQGLTDFVNADNAAAETGKLLKEIGAKGNLGPTHPVIAAEPDRFVDLQKQFYLLPVLEAASTVLKTGHRARVVKVASVTRDAPVAQPAQAVDNSTGIDNFNAAVVFVIDASSSMQPYIDRTRAAMEEVLRQAEAAKVASRIRFGLVAYQDDPAKTKGVEYLSKIFADPNQTATREQFMAATQGVKATASSTRAFAEDGYAALDEALRKINWNNFGGRYVVYISDASAREGNSPLASTRLSTAQMRAHAQERGVAIYAMHLKTPEGKADHALGEAQYKRLSDWPGKGPLYFPVEAGDPARFEAGVKQMATALVEQVKAPQKTLAAPAAAPAAAKADAVQESVDAVGRAMVLAFLGRQQGVKSPAMFEAWASDRDVRNREIPAFTVRVLLTKNQLSDLQSTVRRLVEAYEKTQLDPGSFFNQLRSAAVAMGRDPSKLGQGKAKNLEEAGLMGEYLEGLPYQSQVMGIDFSTWTNMSVGQSQAIIDNLKSLVALYQRFHDDVDRWVKLNPAASDGDKVFPVPIDSLP